MSHYGGRNPIGEKAMTGAERQRLYQQRHREEINAKRRKTEEERKAHEPLKGERFPPCKLCHHEARCKAIQAKEPRWDTWRHDDKLIPFPCMP